VLELGQLCMCAGWPGAATCGLVQCWNRSSSARCKRFPVSRGGRVAGESGRASTCRGESDDVIGSAGARGGAAARY